MKIRLRDCKLIAQNPDTGDSISLEVGEFTDGMKRDLYFFEEEGIHFDGDHGWEITVEITPPETPQ